MESVPIDTEKLDVPLAEKIVNGPESEWVDLTLTDVENALSLPTTGGATTRGRKRKAAEVQAEEEEEAPSGPAGAGAGTVTGTDVAVGPDAKRARSEAPLTRAAIQDMVTQLDSMAGGVVTAVDSAAAKLIALVPDAITLAAKGAVTTMAINNPSIFGQIVRIISGGVSAVVTSAGAASAGWDDYARAVDSAVQSLGGAFESVQGVSASPWFVFTSALLVMRLRAKSQGKSVTDLMKDDARRLKAASQAVAGAVGAGAGAGASAVLTAVEAQAAEFTNAYAKGAREKAAGLLREVARRVDRPTGEGASAMTEAYEMVGAPAARSGPEGAVALVPSRPPQDVRRALEALVRIKAPPKEQRAAEAMLEEEGGGVGSGEDVPMATGPAPAPPATDEDKDGNVEMKKGGKRTKKNKRKTFRKKRGVKKTRAGRASRASRKFIY
jgi:hypothetical protein